jgi:hypothetical protein
MKTMNRSTRFLAALAALLLPLQLFAQPNIAKDTTRYLDSELYEDKEETPTYSWLGGGFSAGYLTLNLDDFNKNLAQPFVNQDVKNTVILYGGQGFFPFPYVRNLRVGGMGYGGVTKVCCQPYTASTGQPETRSLTYSVGYGGLMVDYALPIRWNQFHVLVGTELGLGGLDLEAVQAANRTEFDMNSEFDNPSTNITHTYSSRFFLYKPRVTLEFAPTNFMMINLALGYQGTSMGSWKVDGNVGLGNTDKLNNINASGLVIHAGINIGFFQ